MKRLFISQPMCGKSDEEILLTRAKAVESARNHLGKEVEVIDSFFQNIPNTKNNALWCLGRSLELLATADVAYFAPDWENYRGCKIENLCALEYGITVIEDYREIKEDVSANPKIENAFAYHAPRDGQPEKYQAIREKGKELAYLIDELVPDSREKSLAMTKLEECSMWANAGIARNNGG